MKKTVETAVKHFSQSQVGIHCLWLGAQTADTDSDWLKPLNYFADSCNALYCTYFLL